MYTRTYVGNLPCTYEYLFVLQVQPENYCKILCKYMFFNNISTRVRITNLP